MAINNLKDEIKDILKASVRPSRRELSKNRLETYVFKKHFIDEWCQYCIDYVGAGAPKKKGFVGAPNTRQLQKRMSRAFFIELKNLTKAASAPLSMHDKGDRVIISKLYRSSAGFESSNPQIKAPVQAAKRAAIRVLKKHHKGISGKQDTHMEAALHGHHGGPEKDDLKTTLGMVHIGKHVSNYVEAPIERLADEENQQPKIDLLSEVVRHNFKDYIDIELGYTRGSRFKTSVSSKKAKINVFNDIQIGFALGAGAKGREYTDAMKDWDTPKGRGGSSKLPAAIDNILDRVGKNVVKFISTYVEKNPYNLLEIKGSPSVIDTAVQETPKMIVKNLFPHKSNPDMRLKVNKKLFLNNAQISNISTGMIASKTAKGGVESKRGRKKPRSVAPAGKVDQKAGQNPMALKNLLNEILPQAVAQNMVAPALRYRTGRFANSVRVDNITQGPRGGNTMIEATYRTNPYETFAPGGKQYTPQRDPERLIKRTVRQVASGIIGARFGIDIQ